MGNAQIKLLFPGHDLPFAVPYQNSSDIKNKIDKILADLGPSTKLNKGEWLLVDVAGAELLHNTCLARVRADRTYMVVDVKEAGKMKGTGEAPAGKGIGPPPGYEG
ncbi:uncharacterized protein H6S33_003665 [Morchella sextelata]|uniref:uncharacterized protein n=1 Tax=Morchella sextelata TaxID=1174677 RepID=UPI001D046D26|nr:uncharacterized protein H6S33_003665 [Morchella sextelata]KAH0606831.1 hypothetical protein H6S33_003665 [Morchella sextelata]